MRNANVKNDLEVGALKSSELELIQSMAEAILDSVHTIKAGRESVKGYLLRVNDDNDITIAKEVSFSLGERKTKEVR